MIYFIPAWYKENSWKESEQFWYRRKLHSEFDETIKQIQLFHRNMRIDYRILLLNYAPNLRHFLHRQSVYRAPYWSCFDAIQQVKRSKIAVLSYHRLKWPKGIEFSYSPFAIVAFLNGQKYAQVEFGEDGNMISIDIYTDGIICRRNIYDDRGFVSTTTIFEDGKEKYTDYLMENGKWKMREDADSGVITINQNCPNYDINFNGKEQEIPFRRTVYENMEQVIEEVFQSYLKQTDHDAFITAVHPLHIGLLHRCLRDKPYICTFFEHRYRYRNLESIKSFLNHSNYIITDSKRAMERVKKVVDSNVPCMDISPYDTRTDFGISQQLNVQNILLPVDDIDDNDLYLIIYELALYLLKNKKARVHVFTRKATNRDATIIMDKIAECLNENHFDMRWIYESDQKIESENDLDEEQEEKVEVRFILDQCVDERTISKCLNEQRVILDLRGRTDVFLFVTAISKGVPRISTRTDQYFKDRGNGYLIDDYSQIGTSVSYFLDSFENWNAALVSCYELGKEFTTGILIDAWKEVLTTLE